MDREQSAARGLAKLTGAKLIVAHVREVYASRSGVFLDSTEELEGRLMKTLDDLKRDQLDAELTILKAHAGNAAQVVDNFARDVSADMVIVGGRGHGPVSALVLGSFTVSLLQIATYPVLVVPAGQAEA
jgi:nucleotide-binding universal stress UspA family protein